MGNKIGRRREVVEDIYTRPQGLYQLKGIDHRTLRKLILDSKLAPCYPGLDDGCALDLDECPICFLYYPRLNRSRCCRKLICTECFLQIKSLRSNRLTKCPFCKTTNYVVEYRGERTKEEKHMEKIEEQRVIEAQIRMRQQELRDEEERILKRKKISSSNRVTSPAGGEKPCWSNLSQGDGFISSQSSCNASASRWPLCLRQSREDTSDMDLEDIMIFEAIWLSIQDNGTQKNAYSSGFPQQSSSQDCYISPAISLAESSPSSGFDCVGPMVEHQHMNRDSAATSSNTPVYDIVCSSCSSPSRVQNEVVSYPPESWTKVSSNRKASPRENYEWRTEHEARDGGISYARSNLTTDAGVAPFLLSESVFPGSFEEQMMLTMAISLAESQAGTRSSQGVTWLQ